MNTTKGLIWEGVMGENNPPKEVEHVFIYLQAPNLSKYLKILAIIQLI